MQITKNKLLSEGWKRDELDKFSESYEFRTPENENGDYWFLTMIYDVSNTQHRDWTCHIDNRTFQTVANVDIGTIKEFNKLMDLMNIEYRMHKDNN